MRMNKVLEPWTSESIALCMFSMKWQTCKKAPGQFKNRHPCTGSVPGPCPVSVNRAEPAWFFLGFVVD
jgi:hypothetical protein